MARNDSEKDRNFTSSLSRGLSLLAAFEPSSPRMGITELARKTGLSKSTVFRLVYTMRALGYIIPAGQESKYMLGPKVLSLGFSVLSSLEIREVAHPYLLDLSQKTKETVNLAVLDEWNLIYVERIKTQQIVNINLHVGSRLELYNTSMGKVLAAFQDEDWISRYIEHIKQNPRAKPFWINGGKKFLQIVEGVKKNQFAINDEDFVPGLRSVACPVRNREGQVAGAVNIAVSSSLYSVESIKKDLVPLLQATAHSISLALGYEA